MANKIFVKRSSVAAKVPLTTDLDYGELALNYTDGKLYYKTAGNVINFIDAINTTATLTNKSLTSPTLTGTPIAPTAAVGTVTTQVATTAFADTVALNKAVAMAIALG
jgi:hypothetical protein